MRDAIALDVAYTSRQIEHMLAAYPELAEDSELLDSALLGETDLHRLMSKLVRLHKERSAHIKGLAEYIGDLSGRKARMQRGADGIKTLMLTLMRAAKQPKLVLDEATISMSSGRESVVVDDVDRLPQGYFATQRVADKNALKAALQRGDDIDGAHLEVGDDTLTVRIK